MPRRNSFFETATTSRKGSIDDSVNWEYHLSRSTPQIPQTRWQAFQLFWWNKEEGTVCHRSGTSWAFIFVFYPLFIIFTIGLFYLIMAIMNYCVRSYTKSPVVDKESLTKDPTYL